MTKSTIETRSRSSKNALFPIKTVLKRSIVKAKQTEKPKLGTPRTVDDNVKEKGLSNQQLDEYLKEVHQAFKKLNNKNPSTSNRHKEYICEKTCEKCENIHCDELLLLCDVCDDGYHTFCLSPPLAEVPSEDEEWICPVCVAQKEEKELKERKEKEEKQALTNQNTKGRKNKRQSILDEHFHIPEREAKLCFDCKEPISDKVAPLEEEAGQSRVPKPSKIKVQEICIKCQNYFHPQCFNSKTTTILCLQCEKKVKEVLPKNERNLLSFFGVKTMKRDHALVGKKGDILEVENDAPDSQYEITQTKKVSKKGGKKTTSYSRRLFTFKLPKSSEDPKQVLEQKMSLAYALLSKNIEFNDDLCYSNPKCPSTCNTIELEPNLQKLDKVNTEIFKQFKELTRDGNYAPIKVEENKDQGFIVRADGEIPELTLIAEYVGEVDFARNRVFDSNDSIMDLLRTPHSTTSLVLCPERKGNLARFLSGINNSDKNAKRSKQNVRSVRYSIEGQARVILYAAKTIKKDEILYYDYNEGGFNGYPTQDFV